MSPCTVCSAWLKTPKLKFDKFYFTLLLKYQKRPFVDKEIERISQSDANSGILGVIEN